MLLSLTILSRKIPGIAGFSEDIERLFITIFLALNFFAISSIFMPDAISSSILFDMSCNFCSSFFAVISASNLLLIFSNENLASR